MDGVRERWRSNINVAFSKKESETEIRLIPNDSYDALISLWKEGMLFDFIYVDGSHVAKDVLTDACMAWPMLTVGGVMCFDDYGWGGADTRDSQTQNGGGCVCRYIPRRP